MSYGINRPTYIKHKGTRLGSRSAVEARSALPHTQSLQHVMQECVHPFASSCQFVIIALRRNISCRKAVYLFLKVSKELEFSLR